MIDELNLKAASVHMAIATCFCATRALTVLCAQKHLPRAQKRDAHSHGIDSPPHIVTIVDTCPYQQGYRRPQPRACAECEEMKRGSLLTFITTTEDAESMC